MASDPRGSSTERGYGYAHQQLRLQVARAVNAGQVRCCLCGDPIRPGTPWHLDHTPDRTAYRGAAHESCNTADGGRRRHEKRATARRWSL